MDIYVWTKLYRKTFLDKYHIRFEVGRCDEDFLFNSQAFLYSSLTVMQDSPIYLYTIRDASTSRTFRDQQFLSLINRHNNANQFFIHSQYKNKQFIYLIL